MLKPLGGASVRGECAVPCERSTPSCAKERWHTWPHLVRVRVRVRVRVWVRVRVRVRLRVRVRVRVRVGVSALEAGRPAAEGVQLVPRLVRVGVRVRFRVRV